MRLSRYIARAPDPTGIRLKPSSDLIERGGISMRVRVCYVDRFHGYCRGFKAFEQKEVQVCLSATVEAA